jgi:hypothetical protein
MDAWVSDLASGIGGVASGGALSHDGPGRRAERAIAPRWATRGQQTPQNPNDPQRTRLAQTRIPKRSNALRRPAGVVS